MAMLPQICFLSPDDAPDTGLVQVAPALAGSPTRDGSAVVNARYVERRAARREPILRLLSAINAPQERIVR
jgi:hypothetical protein